MSNFDLSNLALAAVCPSNEIRYDDKGMPSVMVKIPKQTYAQLGLGSSTATHPAFIVNGQEVPFIYISKYQNIIQNGRAYSLPGQDPANNLGFDAAVSACEAKGSGWHLMTNAEWAAIALWCRKNGTMPKGNNNYGKDVDEGNYKAIPTYQDGAAGTGRVATGTGPLTWSHDGTPSGIWDLNGNVWEWVGGYRTVDGEIQVIPNNDAAAGISQSASSTLWKAILQDGSPAAPGTANTLKWDYTADPGTTDTGGKVFRLNTTVQYKQTVEAPYGAEPIENMAAASGVTVPDLLKALALYPLDATANSHGGDYFWMRNLGERLACRGGIWGSGSGAGVFALRGHVPRSYAWPYVGFRSAFVQLPTA